MVLAQSLVNDVSDIGVVRLLGKTGKLVSAASEGGDSRRAANRRVRSRPWPDLLPLEGDRELPFEGNRSAVDCEASPVFRACRCFSVVGPNLC